MIKTGLGVSRCFENGVMEYRSVGVMRAVAGGCVSSLHYSNHPLRGSLCCFKNGMQSKAPLAAVTHCARGGHGSGAIRRGGFF